MDANIELASSKQVERDQNRKLRSPRRQLIIGCDSVVGLNDQTQVEDDNVDLNRNRENADFDLNRNREQVEADIPRQISNNSLSVIELSLEEGHNLSVSPAEVFYYSV